MGKKGKQANNQQKEPRPLDKIQAEFQQSCAQAGHLQYQIDVQSKELARLNEKLKELNVEASLRISLDKASKEAPKATVELPKTETVTTEVVNG